ncbi:MAG: PD-(D/E)XK nuclease family protein [Nitrosomonas sp.]|nr:PD-(D/E)XK nuclease family protein [Nitrosomonas sp.]
MIDRISQFSEISLEETINFLRMGATVVTPNRRLALTLIRKFDQDCVSSINTAWYTADVLPFLSFLERIYSDALYSPQAHVVPQLLSAWQERLLWESIIRSSDEENRLLQHSQAAELAQETWELLYSWNIITQFAHYPLSDDARNFLSWANTYRHLTESNQQIDQARLCDWIAENYQNVSIKKSTSVICYGFDFFTPQQVRLLEKLHSNDCEVKIAYPVSSNQIHSDQRSSKIGYVEFATSRDEIYQAAIWSRNRLEENPEVSIGIVVPDLSSARNTIQRVFTSVMYPDARWSLSDGGASKIVPFNLSLGLPLSSYPLIDTALSCLSLLHTEIPFSRVSQLLQSPFWSGAESEKIPRALLDSELRRFSEPTISLRQLIELIKKNDAKATCPLLLQCLNQLQVFKETQLPKSSSYATFAHLFTEMLQLFGFPGERSLNSEEYQTYQKWQALLVEFASLDRAVSQVSLYLAVTHLKQVTRETLFQPESPVVPIQILGVLEANHVTFDHLWIMNLSHEQWPIRANPNPFIPLELQAKCELPFLSQSQAFAYCKKMTQRWLNSADEVILSYPKNDDDGNELQASPLIHSVAKIPVHLATWQSQDELIAQSCKLQSDSDHQVFALSEKTLEKPLKGGTAVIKDYAACPIRALIKHRLNVKPLDSPHSGLNALERGTLIHDALAHLWQELKSKKNFDALNEEDLVKILTRSANKAIFRMQPSKPTVFSQSFTEIEIQRLINLLREWLENEKNRPDFEVTAIEEKKLIQVSKLLLNVRIDRIDTLDTDEQIIIDYKTSRPSVQTLMGDRLEEPQLPLYLVMTEAQQKAAGAVFATIKAGEFGFSGITKDPDLLSDVKAFSQIKECESFNSWADVIAAWRRQLTALADGFCSGDARIDPKSYSTTCQQCDMQLICRISQRTNAKTSTVPESAYENEG